MISASLFSQHRTRRGHYNYSMKQTRQTVSVGGMLVSLQRRGKQRSIRSIINCQEASKFTHSNKSRPYTTDSQISYLLLKRWRKHSPWRPKPLDSFFFFFFFYFLQPALLNLRVRLGEKKKKILLMQDSSASYTKHFCRFSFLFQQMWLARFARKREG